MTPIPLREQLVAEYQAFLASEGLPSLSADEQDLEQCTREQAAWLRDFIDRWDRAEWAVAGGGGDGLL
jgi:hypothetical protein